MTRVMVLGASYLQVPLIKQLKEMNINTIVIDQNIDAIGIKYADEFYKISTLDKENILELAMKLKPDAILTTATDLPIRTVAYVSEHVGLKSINYQTAVVCTNKVLMGEALEENNIRKPKFISYSSENNSLDIEKFFLQYPLIIKPSVSSGSKGVHRVENKKELLSKINESLMFSNNDELIIEEYIEGHEVSVELLIQDDNIKVIAITDKLLNSPFFVEVGHIQPSKLDDEIKNKIINLSIRAVKALNITSGAAHVEIRVEENTNLPYIIEVGARLGGDYITSHLTPKSTNVNMLEGLVNIALGKKLNLHHKPQDNEYYSVQFILNTKVGRFKGLRNVDEVVEKFKSNIMDYEVLIGKDEELKPNNSSNDKVVFFMIKTSTYDEQLMIGKEIRETVKVIIE